MNNSETEITKFTSAFDYAYIIGEKDFIDLIITNSLTTSATKRSIIIPTKEEIKYIKNIKSKEEKIMAISAYILNTNVMTETIKEHESMQLYVFLGKKTKHYITSHDENKIFFNDVEVEEVKKLEYTTLYRAKGKLQTSEETEENEENEENEETEKETEENGEETEENEENEENGEIAKDEVDEMEDIGEVDSDVVIEKQEGAKHIKKPVKTFKKSSADSIIKDIVL